MSQVKRAKVMTSQVPQASATSAAASAAAPAPAAASSAAASGGGVPAAVAAQTAVPVWTCAFSPLESAEPLANLTVGSKFDLKCHGDIPVQWNAKEALTLAFKSPEDQFTLAVLKVTKLEAQDAEFLVTGYKPGKHQPEYIRILQGGAGFEFTKPTWEIKSVLKPNEKPELVGPLGPFQVALPHWIWISALITFLLLLYVVFHRVRKMLQRRRMLEELKRHRTALSPLHQFYRDARTLRKRLHDAKIDEELKTIAEDLNRDFRLYVLRQFEIPTLEWTEGEIISDLRKRHRGVWSQAADPLRKTLIELLRLKNRPQVLLKDVEQLHRMSLDTAERLQHAREGVKR